MQISRASLIPSIEIGGRVFTDLANLKILRGYIVLAANNRTNFRLTTATSDYVVATGKQLRVLALKINNKDGVAGSFSIGYSDNDAGLGTNTAFTNPVWLGGSVNFYFPTAAADGSEIQFETNFVVPAGKYPAAQATTDGATINKQITLYCYEESV